MMSDAGWARVRQGTGMFSCWRMAHIPASWARCAAGQVGMVYRRGRVQVMATLDPMEEPNHWTAALSVSRDGRAVGSAEFEAIVAVFMDPAAVLSRTPCQMSPTLAFAEFQVHVDYAVITRNIEERPAPGSLAPEAQS